MQCRPGSGQVCHETLLWRQSASCGSAISEKVSLPSNVVSSLTPEWTLSLVSLHYIFKAALIDFNGLRGAVEGTANKVWTFKNCRRSAVNVKIHFHLESHFCPVMNFGQSYLPLIFKERLFSCYKILCGGFIVVFVGWQITKIKDS